jgi:sialic acid synthase SpsE
MDNTAVCVIAEAGTNHNGKVENARALIDLAARAQADSVKFQIINPDFLYLPGVYAFGKYDINEVRAMRKRFMLTDAQYRELATYARGKGIAFSASVFDEHGLELLAAMHPPYIKIASTDLNNVRLLRRVAEKGIRMIVSTGMSSLGDIEKSVNEITRVGLRDLVLMHCVSTYPASLAEMNLGFIDTLRSAFGFPVGLSDHTESSIAACMALVKGISYIEKHFTMDRTQEGFDHAYAVEGEGLVAYIQDLRSAERALAFSPVKINQAERLVRGRARRALYASRPLKTGQVVTDADVLIVRPENIMAADRIGELVGRRLRQDVGQFQPFSPEMVD